MVDPARRRGPRAVIQGAGASAVQRDRVDDDHRADRVHEGHLGDVGRDQAERPAGDASHLHRVPAAFRGRALLHAVLERQDRATRRASRSRQNPATASTGAPRINPAQQRQRSANGVGGAPPPGNAGVGGGFLCYLPGNQVFDYRPFEAGALIPAGLRHLDRPALHAERQGVGRPAADRLHRLEHAAEEALGHRAGRRRRATGSRFRRTSRTTWRLRESWSLAPTRSS